MPDLTLHEEIDRLLELAHPIVITGGKILDDGRPYASFVWPASLGALAVPADEFLLIERSALRPLAERVREQDAEIARLRIIAATYGDHHGGCALFSGYDCSCGWSKARAALAQKPQKEEPS